jgi:CARDB
MVRKRRSISVVMIVTFLVFMGMAATGFPAQKPAAQQSPNVQQTTPLKATPAPVRVTATLGVSPASYSGNCPALITFRGHITVSQPTTVQYKFIRSDNAQAPVQTLNFPRAGTQEVTTTWQLGGPGVSTSGWEAIQVISPVSVESNKAAFRIRCAGQQGGPVQQTGPQVQPVGPVQQPGPQVQQGAPVRIKAELGVKPASYSGNCPALISFRGFISVSQPTTVQYKFIRSDNAQAPVQTLNFPKAGTQEVTDTWQLGGPGVSTSGWEAIQVISPVSVGSNKAVFKIRCTGQGQQGAAEPQGQLPDLAIEDITLNEQCFVVVTAKNNGPGMVPDKVWTERAPDSSAIYLYINGKKWGGQTIAGFDPSKNLQNPGGTATMTSNLKVTGTATIGATIDSTGKVRETNEANNAMKKQLTCQARVSVQPGATVQPSATAQPGVVTQPGVVVKPGMVAQPSVGKEDCISFNPATTTVQQIQGSWKIVDGSMWLLDFGAKKGDADRSLAIIKHYGMNQQCFVGRPHAPFQYYLVSGASPVGPFGGEDCISFNPATTTVQQVQGSWKVVDGSHWMFDFGANKAEADQTLAIIKKYGFTYTCYVGRPGPKFTYLRK